MEEYMAKPSFAYELTSNTSTGERQSMNTSNNNMAECDNVYGGMLGSLRHNNLIGNTHQQQQQQQMTTVYGKRKLDNGFNSPQIVSTKQQQHPQFPSIAKYMLTDTIEETPSAKQRRMMDIEQHPASGDSIFCNNKGVSYVEELINNAEYQEQFQYNNIMKTEPESGFNFEGQKQQSQQQGLINLVEEGNSDDTMTFLNLDPVPSQVTTQLAILPPENKGFIQQMEHEDPVKPETSEILLNFKSTITTASNNNNNNNFDTISIGSHTDSISKLKASEQQFITQYIKQEEQQLLQQLQHHKRASKNTLNSFPLGEDSNGPSDYFNEKIDKDGDT